MTATLTLAVRLNNGTGLRKCSNFGLIFKSHRMNRIILAISLASIMMGCSTAFRTGQTIDDVYFSPARPGAEYVNLEEEDEYRASEVPMTDRYMRMKAFGGSRWNAFDDDYAYWNNPHWNNSNYFNLHPTFGYSGMNSLFWGRPMPFGMSPYLNPFSPNYYGQPVIVLNSSKSIAPNSTGPRTYSLSNYTPMRTSAADPKLGGGFFRSGGQSSNSGSNIPRGGYNPRTSGESYSSPSRTFSNSSNSGSSSSSSSSNSSGSSSSSSSSGSAPVRSFPRGGN